MTGRNARRCQNPWCWDYLSPLAAVPLCRSCRAAWILGSVVGVSLAYALAVWW